MGYNYNKFLKDINLLAKKHPFLDLFSIGESVMQKKIYCLGVGKGKKKLFINGAHHGLEYLTSLFIVKFLDEFCQAFNDESDFFGYNTKNLYNSVTLFAVPMVNPDGVDIAVDGIDITNPYHQKLISMVGIHSFNKVWQANALGVDINHNYDANWKVVAPTPAPTKYAGPYSESEPETKTIVEFVKNEKFDMLIAFHSQGGEIYYDFDGTFAPHSEKIAKEFSKVSGYTVAKPTGDAVFGGCKDWFIKEFGKAGFTIEIGHGKNPLPAQMLAQIYDENAKIVLSAMQSLADDTQKTFS